MLKVLIADDEEKICQLILKLIDWEKLGLEVVATVSNGLDAVRVVESHKPEIIITDIRMPGIDGMELIEKVKELSPDTEAIIISGYRHFEYAQTAIRFGVRNYLLKPIRKDELNETLRKISDAYREKNEQLGSEERVKLILKNDAGRLRAGFIAQMAYGNPDQENFNSIKDVNGRYHFDFREGLFQIAGIKFDTIEYDEHNMVLLANKVTDIMEQTVDKYCYDSEIYVKCTSIYILLNYAQEEQRDIKKGIRQMFNELKQLSSFMKGLKVTVGVGKATASVNGIGQSLTDARHMLLQRIILGTGRVIEDQEGDTDVFIHSETYYQFNRTLERALESLCVMELRTAVYGLKDTLAAVSGISGHEILKITEEVCSSYLHYMKSKKIPVENEQEFMAEFCRKARDCSDIDKLFGYLASTLCNSFKNVSEAKKAEDNKPIRLAKQYMQENYMNQVTLEDVSAIVGFAPGYFSTLFKKETGMSFLEYLQSVRMEAAKRLLVSDNDGMSVVCEKVGYSDVKYFTRCFVKYTGLRPGEYRKIYS